MTRPSTTTIPTVLGRCPVCTEELQVTRLHCPHCDTGIDGRFQLSRFQRLTAEQLAFVETFVRNRGIIKDVEAELKISYPTVRARLDDAIRAMGFPAAGEGGRAGREGERVREERRRVLEDLQARRITADEAQRELQRIAAG
jgi:hypothetical protein